MNQTAFKKLINKELEKLTNEQRATFAWRCAVRSLPFLGSQGNFDYWKKQERQQHLYAVFFALDIATNYDASNNDDARAAAKAIESVVDAASYDDAARAAVKAIESAFDAAAYAATFNDDSSYFNNVAKDADDAARAAVYYSRADDNTSFNIKDFQSLILQDVRAIQGEGVSDITINFYGKIWDNFQKALKAEGCEYWGDLYQSIFDNKFVLDLEALKQRLSVPEIIKERGLASITAYFQGIDSLLKGDASTVFNTEKFKKSKRLYAEFQNNDSPDESLMKAHLNYLAKFLLDFYHIHSSIDITPKGEKLVIEVYPKDKDTSLETIQGAFITFLKYSENEITIIPNDGIDLKFEIEDLKDEVERKDYQIGQLKKRLKRNERGFDLLESENELLKNVITRKNKQQIKSNEQLIKKKKQLILAKNYIETKASFKDRLITAIPLEEGESIESYQSGKMTVGPGLEISAESIKVNDGKWLDIKNMNFSSSFFTIKGKNKKG